MVTLLFVIIGGYVLSSFILLRFPLLIHKKKRKIFSPTTVAHRGGAGESIENTIGAFDCAVRMGVDVLEIDCHLTKDEHVVIIHDDNLLRVTGQEGFVYNTNYSDLPKIKNTLEVHFDRGNFTKAEPNMDLSIPLLRDVFKAFPRVIINIDLKSDSDLLVEKVSNLITEFNREDITIWGSFSDLVSKKCRLKNPRIAMFFSAKQTLCVYFFYLIGLLPFVSLEPEFFEVPLITSFCKLPNITEDLQSFIKRKLWWLRPLISDISIQQFIIRMLYNHSMSPKIYNHMKARGISVFFWVCNHNDEFEQAFNVGAESVVTDYPSRLLTYLNDHPHIKLNRYVTTKPHVSNSTPLSGSLNMKLD